MASIAAAMALCAYFWNDFCLWRAEVQLKERRSKAATAWMARGQWFTRTLDSRACLLHVRIARSQRDFEDVNRYLKKAVELGAPLREIHRERLLAMAQAGQFVEMQDSWPLLLSDQRDDGPEIARAYYNWSMLNHQLDQAEKILQLWHADYPRDPEPLVMSGRFYESQIKWEDAEDAYRKAFALAPGNDEYRLAFARALQARLKTGEAIPLYQEHLRRLPDDLVALRGLAQCEATNGNLEVAIQLLLRALEKKPDDFAVLKAYGEALLSRGDAAGAVVALQQANRQVPEHANTAYALARALKECGRVAEAEPLFAFVAESKPKLDEISRLEKQLRKQPDDIDLRMQIASLTAKYVSRKDAIRWYETLLQVAPRYVPARAALAELYRQTGDLEKAKQQTDDETHGAMAGDTSDLGRARNPGLDSQASPEIR